MTDRSDFFWSKVQVLGSGCWQWLGAKTRGGPSLTGKFHRNRYGSMRIPCDIRGSKTIRVHRWAYARFRKRIPYERDLDHTCINSLCVNPWHLKPVTKSKNTSLQNRRAAARRQSSQQ